MVTTYQILKALKGSGLFPVLIETTIIPAQYIKYIYVYESYLACNSEDRSKSSCYQETASRCFISVDRVRKIISEMQKEFSIEDCKFLQNYFDK
jgi:hypothetical protein